MPVCLVVGWRRHTSAYVSIHQHMSQDFVPVCLVVVGGGASLPYQYTSFSATAADATDPSHTSPTLLYEGLILPSPIVGPHASSSPSVAVAIIAASIALVISHWMLRVLCVAPVAPLCLLLLSHVVEICLFPWICARASQVSSINTFPSRSSSC